MKWVLIVIAYGVAEGSLTSTSIPVQDETACNLAAAKVLTTDTRYRNIVFTTICVRATYEEKTHG